MKLTNIRRLYYISLVILLAGWVANLHQALSRTSVDWRDAIDFPLISMTFVILALLLLTSGRLKRDPKHGYQSQRWSLRICWMCCDCRHCCCPDWYSLAAIGSISRGFGYDCRC